MISLESKIEAVLFSLSEPISLTELARIFEVDQSAIKEALTSLSQNLSGRGIGLVEHGTSVTLASVPEASVYIEALKKEELNKELSKAALETLSIVLYRPDGATRADIDYIRGVNSSFILRNLAVRGLVERTGGNRPMYKPTLELLTYMGVSRAEDLTDFASISEHLSKELSNQITSQD